jgi:hypothetical protein
MAEVVIPEIKHEYIRQVDTETTKDDWFDECIADNKEAAWAGIGTSENDSQYQPASSVEPDYYMQYCSSDDYDYLKDYRLIWGYDIGIIEQDVICSLSTGEHLAEGKDACDTYATENAAGEDTDWERGIWIKFSGNRNVSPTRIGEVILPERVISLKDLCAALTLENPCDFYLPQENSILNAQNLCGTKTNSPITLCLSDEAGMPFGGVLNLSYAFAYTNARIWQFDTYGVDESYMFYHAKIGPLVVGAMDVINNYTSKFEEAIGDGESILYPMVLDKAMFKNSTNLIIETTATTKCREDVSECFYGCDIYMDITGIDFSNARNVQSMFYRINAVKDEINLDLSSFVEHDDDVEDRFNNFFCVTKSISLNITAPECKLKGFDVFYASNSTINLINELHYYDIWDLKDFQLDNTSESRYKFKSLFNCSNITINGTIYGIGLFTCNLSGIRIINSNSNLIVKTEENSDYNINDIIDFYHDKSNGSSFDANYFPTIILNTSQYIDFNLNIDDFVFVNCVSFYNASREYTQELNSINVDKTNKEFYIVNRKSTCPLNINITINNNSIIKSFSGVYDNIWDYNNTNIPLIDLINEDESPNNDLIIYKRFNGTKIENFKYIKINAPSCNVIFSEDSIPSTIDYRNYYVMYYYFINVKSFNDNNFPTSFSNRYRYFKFVIEVVNKIISNEVSKPYFHIQNNLIDKILTNDNNIIIETNGHGIRPLVLESLDKINYIEYPTINTTGDNYERIGLIGNLNNVPLSRFLQRRWQNSIYVYSANNLIEKIIDDIEDYDIDLGNYGYANDDIIYFSINQSLEHNIICGIIRVNYSYNRNIVTSEIKGLQKNNTYDRTLNTYLCNLKGDLDLKCCFTLYVSDCPELTGINYTQIVGNERDTTALNFDESVTNITTFNFTCEYEDVIENLNLSYMDKLNQESINTIVEPNKFVSGATLTINTIPFQYITEEQKQALVDAGVTLVEYIPTETTE